MSSQHHDSLAAGSVEEVHACLDSLFNSASGVDAPLSIVAALRSLAAACSRSRQAADVARRRGAAGLLRRWLCSAEEEVVELAVAATASLAGLDTRSERSFAFPPHTLHIRDASAVEAGLGWRVWVAAPALCRLLLQAPELVAGRTVLELGAGVGLCGLLAAALGAARVQFTDVASLLPALRVNIDANVSSCPDVSCSALDWDDEACASEPLLAGQADLLLGSDVLYDLSHAAALPRVIARRLAPGGTALLVCGVRFPAVLDAFHASLPAAQLVGERTQLPLQPGDGEEDEDRSVTMAVPLLGLHCWRIRHNTDGI